jgi:uncharacterized protein YkwD
MSHQLKKFNHAKFCMSLLLSLSLSLILVACGGGSGGSATNSDGNDVIPPTQSTQTTNTAASPTPTPAAPTAAVDNDFTCAIPNFQAEFVALVNSARAQGAVCGAKTMKPSKPLAWNDSLSLAAKIHSDEMAIDDFFAHDSPKTGSLRERIHSTGYQYEEAGENLAGGQTTIAKAVSDWVKSPSHCANMLNPDFKEMGAACKKNSNSYYKTYWTLEMALPLGGERDDEKEDVKDDLKKLAVVSTYKKD